MDKMKQYKVTLNLRFEEQEPSCSFDETIEYEYDKENELDMEEKEERDAFARTDKYFEDYDVEDYIKENDPLDFVENLICNGEVISAEWDMMKFQVHMVIDTEMTKEQLIEDLKWSSLEDSEYEGCGNTGWLVMTRGPNNKEFGAPWDMKGYWIYGLTDYRENPIEVEELAIKEDIPKEEELFTMTEKGKDTYRKIAALKLEGICFSEEDELKFKVMKILMKDKRLYPLGKA